MTVLRQPAALNCLTIQDQTMQTQKSEAAGALCDPSPKPIWLQMFGVPKYNGVAITRTSYSYHYRRRC
ncbi:hypothetical protein CEXT_65201 [Caerostris extrusa]|uniref:Uncharacterized protein n=1 Tax=Caerostris extrusa TaxID=172846 RepID=A0AAV4VF87_CAEEX|nr:hypothetical protein CEXT_65201 [Caerostris extrusa]